MTKSEIHKYLDNKLIKNGFVRVKDYTIDSYTYVIGPYKIKIYLKKLFLKSSVRFYYSNDSSPIIQTVFVLNIFESWAMNLIDKSIDNICESDKFKSILRKKKLDLLLKNK